MPLKPTSSLRQITPLLAFACSCLLVGDMLFGFDTASFGGILANPGFINQFGIKNAKGVHAMGSLRTSLTSSLAFIGKFIGCFVAGPLIERFGHKKVFYLLSAISCAGVIIEITAAGTSIGSGRLPQFIIGRIIVYVSVGLVEVAVTTYQSEIVPAPFRGLVVLSLQLFLVVGGIIATSVNKAFSTYTNSIGWKSVTGIQFLFPVLICSFVPFIPDSPRWLLSKDRDEDAMISMRKLRSPELVAAGKADEEIHQIKIALSSNVHKTSWLTLVKGTNLRRTLLVLAFYTFQQITGQAFTSTYQTVFYKTNGYADKAFVYPIMNSCLSLVGVIPGMYLVDAMGRRPLFMLSCALQALFMFILAGLGSHQHKTAGVKGGIIAAFMLYSNAYVLGGAAIPYLLAAEIPAFSVREKTAALGAAVNVIWAFATNFAIPYMLAALNFKVGWIFGGISVVAVLFTSFFLPETKGRALEEIDAIFAKPFNPFKPMVIHPDPAARRVGELEGEYPETDIENKSFEREVESTPYSVDNDTDRV